MTNSTETAISVQETINAKKEKTTRIFGDTTREGINNQKEEIAGILVGVKYKHFREVRTNRHLAVIFPVEEYRTSIGNNAWMYDPPVNLNT